MRQWSARQWIGLYEFLAGCAGFGVTLVVTPNLAGQVPVQWRTQFWLAVAAALGMFGVVAAAGVLLMRRHRLGVGLSAVVQALQVPLWAVVGGTRWVFFAGVYLAPLLVDEQLTMLAGLRSNLEVMWRQEAGPAFLGINLAPLVVLWILYRSRRTTTERSAVRDELAAA